MSALAVILGAEGAVEQQEEPAGRKGRERDLGRPALHAATLGFVHPRSGVRMRFEAPLHGDLVALLESLERREGTRK